MLIRTAEGLVRAIEKEDRTLFALANPDIAALTDENISKISNIKATLEKIINRIPAIRSLRTSELSVYQLRIDRIAERNTVISHDKALAAKLAKIQAAGKPKVASFKVRNVAELRWLAKTHRDALERYGEDKYPVKLHIRIADPNITKDNIGKVLELTGANDVLTVDDISFTPTASVSGIYETVSSKYGAEAKDIAIGDISDFTLVVDEEGKRLVAEENLLLVMTEKGIASQLYDVVVELIANDNEIPRVMPYGANIEKNVMGFFSFRPVKPIDMDVLRLEIEQYERVLMAA